MRWHKVGEILSWSFCGDAHWHFEAVFFNSLLDETSRHVNKKMTCLISDTVWSRFLCIYFQTRISAEWLNEPWVVSGSNAPLRVPAHSAEVCWKRGTGFTNYTTSSLIRSVRNTICVHTNVLYVSEDHPLSRLGINHIFLPTASL